MSRDREVEQAVRWLEAVEGRSLADPERRVLLHGGPHHVRQLVLAHWALYRELERLWSVEGLGEHRPRWAAWAAKAEFLTMRCDVDTADLVGETGDVQAVDAPPAGEGATEDLAVIPTGDDPDDGSA